LLFWPGRQQQRNIVYPFPAHISSSWSSTVAALSTTFANHLPACPARAADIQRVPYEQVSNIMPGASLTHNRTIFPHYIHSKIYLRYRSKSQRPEVSEISHNSRWAQNDWYGVSQIPSVALASSRRQKSSQKRASR
jgi:hypothetical protein